MTSFTTSTSTTLSDLKHRIQALEQQVSQLMQLTQNLRETISQVDYQICPNQNHHLEGFVPSKVVETEPNVLDSAESEDLEIAYQCFEDLKHYYHETPWCW